MKAIDRIMLTMMIERAMKIGLCLAVAALAWTLFLVFRDEAETAQCARLCARYPALVRCEARDVVHDCETFRRR